MTTNTNTNTKNNSFKMIISSLITIIVVILAIFIGILKQDSQLRHLWFSKLMSFAQKAQQYQGTNSSDNTFQKLRCDILLRNLTGPILVEIGPGAGANFECLTNLDDDNNIEKYYGFEPNTFLHDYLKDEIKKTKVNEKFEIEIITDIGENIIRSNNDNNNNMIIEDESIDSVIITHVLCSVTNVTEVLENVNRILKPGGKLYFMEHIAAPKRTFTRMLQIVIEPIWKIIADGCSFRELYFDLDKMDNYEMNYQYLDGPFPLSILKPHIIGIGTKKDKDKDTDKDKERER